MNEIKITIPEGYVGIDEEKSNLAEGKIVFKKKEDARWKDTEHVISGYYINDYSCLKCITDAPDDEDNKNIFATEKQAKSALAMAQISQIMANDKRFGGVISPDEWKNHCVKKFTIELYDGRIDTDYYTSTYFFLAFHTAAQRDLFLKENEQLVKDYYMID